MSQDKHLILTVNPGSTSTKIGIYENETCLKEKNLHHSTTQLEKFEKVWDQYEFRKNEIIRFVRESGFDLADFSCVVGRGGLLKPIESGTYRVDQRMISDLRRGVLGTHASNLGGVLAYGIGWDYGKPAFIVDPPSVDELMPIARLSGLAELPRISLFHALNIKATALKAARDMGRELNDLNLIVAHLGGGITVAAIEKGRIVDVNEGLSEGPFTPERAGAVPTIPLVELCFSGKYTLAQIKKKLVGGGGLVSYLNTNDAREVEDLARAGNPKARLVYEAMAYQVAKEIGARAVALCGKVDAILMTGGLARSEPLMNWIEERCSFIAPYKRYPGENELEALALGGLRVMRGQETARVYDAQDKVIGIFYSEFVWEYDVAVSTLESRLRDLGYRFRQSDENLELLIRNCHRKPEKMDEAIREFMDRGVDLMVAIGSPAAMALKPVLDKLDIPVVLMGCFDPVVMGLVESYAEPRRNITGTAYRISVEDQLNQGLLPLMPGLKRLGVIYRSGQKQSEIQLDEAKEVCERLGIDVIPFDAQSAEDIPASVEYLRKREADAVFLGSNTTVAHATREELEPLVTAFPTLCTIESSIIKGGLVGRAADWAFVCEEAAKQAIAVLEGTSASKLPIIRNPKAETMVNTGAAKKHGIKLSKDYLSGVARQHPWPAD